MQTDQIVINSTNVGRIFDIQKNNARKVATSTLSERREKLKLLQKNVLKYREELKSALYADFKKPAPEADLIDVFPVVSEIKHAIRHLPYWMRSRSVDTPTALLGTSSYIQYEAKGVCLIISPWNFPVNLTLCPLVSAIAAGNCVILKPSEMTPHTSSVLKKLIQDTFSPDEIALVEGDVSVSTELLKLPFNHIFFTGAPSIGKVVMRAAAEHLTSVTLELGGKSPVIIDETTNIDAAARRIVAGKFTNCGQTCIAPDYLLVHQSKKNELIDALKKSITQLLGASDEERIKGDYTAIVNNRHFNRVKSYLDDAVLRGATVITGGKYEEASNYLAPTLLGDVTDDMLVMQEEIFGPLLPVLTYDSIETAISYIREREKPLALYIFSTKRKNQDYILQHTSAGNVSINDIGIHFMNNNLPFGGINNSGIGKSHGEFGFQEFSNAKGILKQHLPKSALELFYPPFTPSVKKMINWVLNII